MIFFIIRSFNSIFTSTDSLSLRNAASISEQRGGKKPNDPTFMFERKISAGASEALTVYGSVKLKKDEIVLFCFVWQ